MAETQSSLLTLTEVAKRTGISMPTLQRYKKLYQSRIPSEGSGRRQRYPNEALQVFLQIRKENESRRGRPRKSSRSVGAKPAKATRRKARAKAPGGASKRTRRSAGGRAARRTAAPGALTLTEIGRITGISYPTLMRYVRDFLPELPHVGAGRKRRFLPAAVDRFRELRARSGRRARTAIAAGRRAGVRLAREVDAGLAARLRDLEKSQRDL